MLRPDSLAATLLLTALVAFGPLSTDLYLPALPGMTDLFSTDVAHVQLTLSVFLAGFAISQLFVGPLSDRFGRRPVLLFGLCLYTIASIACTLADSIGLLIWARMFQAMGACSGVVIGRAIVRDVYGPDGSARILAYIGMAMATAPMIAPVIGGYLITWFDWRACFVVLAVFGIILFILVSGKLQETNQHKNPEAINPGRMIANYRILLGNRLYIGYILTNAFIYCGLFSFISGSSFVLISFLGVTPKDFGLYFGIVVFGYISGSFVTGRLSRRIGKDTMILYGSVLSLLIGAMMAGLAQAGVATISAIVGPMFLFMACVGMVMPNAMAGAIGPFPKMAGAASALMGFTQMGAGATISFAIGQFDDATQIPMTTAIAVMGLCSFLSYLFIVRPASKVP